MDTFQGLDFYILKVLYLRLCLPTGEWSGDPATCTIKTCRYSFEKNFYKYFEIFRFIHINDMYTFIYFLNSQKNLSVLINSQIDNYQTLKINTETVIAFEL